MRRRRVLALLSSTAAAGCLGGGSGSRTTERGTTPATPSTDATAPTTGASAVVGEPLPSECPVLSDDVRRVVCYPGTDAPCR